MMAGKQLHGTITTIGMFEHALKKEDKDLQLYLEGENGVLIEITEIMKVLPKEEGHKPFIILRTY